MTTVINNEPAKGEIAITLVVDGKSERLFSISKEFVDKAATKRHGEGENLELTREEWKELGDYAYDNILHKLGYPDNEHPLNESVYDFVEHSYSPSS